MDCVFLFISDEIREGMALCSLLDDDFSHSDPPPPLFSALELLSTYWDEISLHTGGVGNGGAIIP